MKVHSKPVVAQDKAIEKITFEFEGKEYQLYVHAYGSHTYFHAARFLLENAAATGARQMMMYAEYAAMLVDHWPSESDEFFGGAFTDEFVKLICINPKNIWLVSAIAAKAKEDEKK